MFLKMFRIPLPQPLEIIIDLLKLIGVLGKADPQNRFAGEKFIPGNPFSVLWPSWCSNLTPEKLLLKRKIQMNARVVANDFSPR